MYFVIVIATTIVLPIASALIDIQANLGWDMAATSSTALLIEYLGKWYAFWAGGVRLMLAALRQILMPEMTLKNIFEIDHPPSGHIVQELGFANFAIAVLCLASLPLYRLLPGAMLVASLFYGLAGFQHLRKTGRNAERTLAMLTDLLVFAVLAVAFVFTFSGGDM